MLNGECLPIRIDFSHKPVEVQVTAAFFEIELDFGERKAARVADDWQVPDQAAIGVVLMVVCIENRLLHRLEMGANRRIAVHDGAYRKEVYAVSHQNPVIIK